MPPLARLMAGLMIVVAVGGWMWLRERPPRAMVQAAVVDLQGFEEGPGQAPAAGEFAAVGVYTASRGFARTRPGRIIKRPWWIEKRCQAGRCDYVLTRGQASLPAQTATLVRKSDGWHATFPPQTLQCGVDAAGAPILWQQEDRLVLHFDAGGRAAIGRASKFSYEPSCGYGSAALDWHVTARG